MELKKTDKANLENKKALFTQIGLIVALSLMIFAFEYKSYDKKEVKLAQKEAVNQVDEVVMQTQEDTPPPEQASAPEVSTTEFTIVINDAKITNVFNVTSLDVQGGNIGVTATKIEIAAEPEELKEEKTIFTVVEQEASFPGGYDKLMEYLSKNIKYPQQARETGTKGRVMLTFVVEKDGSITDIKVLRDIGSGCGEEAIRVVKTMPKWAPAKQRGKAVRQQFNLPVVFNLQG
jgi:TonB family C-terminal domain